VTRVEMPYNADRHFTMELVEEAEAATQSILWVERLQVGFAFLNCVMALLIAFQWLGEIGYGVALGLGVLCFVGFIISRVIKILLLDFYRQLQYREKFLAFLMHAAVVVCPYFFLGLRKFGFQPASSIVFSLLLVVLSFQAIDRLHYGRIQAVTMLLVFLACFRGDPAPSPLMLAVWFPLFLLGVRFSHLAFRLEEFGEGRGIDLGGALRRSLAPCGLALVAGIAGYLLPLWLLSPPGWTIKSVDLTPQPAVHAVPMGDWTSLLWRGIVLILIIVATLIFMNWVDQKLRSRKQGTPLVDEIGGSAAKTFRYDSLPEEKLSVEQSAGPREIILTAFSQFQDRLSRIDMGRKEDETVADYFLRLERMTGVMSALEAMGSTPFNQACYDDHEPTAEDADHFVKLIDSKLEELRSSHGRTNGGGNSAGKANR
jgi:hypothetical protein